MTLRGKNSAVSKPGSFVIMNHQKFDDGENLLFRVSKGGSMQFYSFDKVTSSYREEFFHYTKQWMLEEK
jgi:hypothetical protein